MTKPTADHYRSAYLGPNFERLFAYQYQLNSISLPPPARILLIGKGDGFIANTLLDMGYQVETLDIASDLHPTYVADVRQIPAKNQTYDIVMCCQVLEHLPFDDLSVAFNEICRVAKAQIIISIPDQRRFISCNLKIFRFSLKFQFSFERTPSPDFPTSKLEEMGHFWEVGFKGFSGTTVLQKIAAKGWRSKSERVYGFPWHLFITLEKD